MKDNAIKALIWIGVFVICLFPAIAIFSFFTPEKIDTQNNIKLDKQEPLYLNEIEKNDNAKIDISEILAQKENEIIVDEEMPLAVNTKNLVTGANVKTDFKAHEKAIESGDIVFEILTKEGRSLFFKTYEELDYLVSNKAKYEKNFSAPNGKLNRYTYVEKD